MPKPRLAPMVLALLLLAPTLSAAGGAAAAEAAEAPVRIALLDTGILPTHSEFAEGQVVAWRDFVNGRSAPYDDHGHGTAVASRAAGRTIGSAPGTDLIVAKVLDQDGRGSWHHLNRGIRWAADQGADVISISIWVNSPNALNQAVHPYYHAFISRAIDHATAKGALVVWIAGNGGEHTVPYSTTLPGSASPQVLVVGAVDDSGRIAPFSQQDPEVVAPGWDVRIAWSDGSIHTGSGTSYAGPWVAGAAAALLEEGAPRRDPDWLKWVVTHSAQDRPEEPYLKEGYGWFGPAQLDAARLVARGEAPVPAPDARDAEHAPTMAARVALSAALPTGALPP